MLIESDNMVSAAEFRKDFDRYNALARGGNGPIAVTDNSKVVGFYISAEEYDAMFGTAVRELLNERERGPTISHQDVKDHVAKKLKQSRG
jgi:PHD/YefM family antitoxin component YafN of YafNO toxin-antitoxin module